MPGFIKVDRETIEWLRNDPVKLSWWIDILMECNIAPKEVVIKGHLYKCLRGECLNSLDTWSKRWRTDKSSVRRFFDALKARHTIDTVTDTRTTHLKLDKSIVYEDEKHTIDTVTSTRSTPTKEERIKKEINTAPFESGDLNTNWNEWLVYLKEKRKSPTPSTANKQIGFLKSLNTQQAIISIQKSITSGWVGLFTPKEVVPIVQKSMESSRFKNITHQ